MVSRRATHSAFSSSAKRVLRRGAQGHALAARAHGGEHARRGGGHEHQGGVRGRLFEQAQQGVLGLLVEPLGVGDDRHATPALGAAHAQGLLERAHLADAHARVVGAAFHPEEVGVVAHVAQHGALLAGAVELDQLALPRPGAGGAGLAGRVASLAHGASGEAQRHLPAELRRAGNEVGRVHAVAREGTGEQLCSDVRQGARMVARHAGPSPLVASGAETRARRFLYPAQMRTPAEAAARPLPAVVLALSLLGGAAFVYATALDEAALSRWFETWGLVPRRWLRALSDPGPGLLTPLSAVALHASLLHLVGNLFFLWLFGEALEALLGPLRFAILALSSVLAAAVGHVLTDPEGFAPAVGASGLVSGLVGAYLRLGRRVPPGLRWHPAGVSPRVFAGVWCVFLVVGELRGAEGLASGAHLAGLGAGALLAGGLAPRLEGE